MIYLLLFVLSCLGWIVSILAAGGGAILLLPCANLFLPTRIIAPALSIGSTLSSIHRVWLFWRDINWKILQWLLPGLFLGAFLGGYLFSQMEADWLKIVIALFLITHALHHYLSKKRHSFTMRLFYFLPAGFVTALLSGIVGAVGPIMNPFYLNYEILKKEMIGTKAASTLAMQIFKIIAYLSFGVLTSEIFVYGLCIGLGALTGNYIGKQFLQRIKDASFRHIVNAFLLLSGILMLYKYFLP